MYYYCVSCAVSTTKAKKESIMKLFSGVLLGLLVFSHFGTCHGFIGLFTDPADTIAGWFTSLGNWIAQMFLDAASWIT